MKVLPFIHKRLRSAAAVVALLNVISPQCMMVVARGDEVSRSHDIVGGTTSCARTFAYAFFRVPLSALDLTLRIDARVSIWQDVLRMSAATQAMLIAAVKSTDFLLGFLVGWSSDGLKSRFGRRRPFIALLFPIGLTAFTIFCLSGYIFGAKEAAKEWPCADLVVADNGDAAMNASSCPALKQCLADAIANGLLDPPDGGSSTNATAGATQNGGAADLVAYRGELSFAFALVYFGYIFSVNTGTQIPYDALGMEMELDYHKRTRFFAFKALAQFSGYLLHPVVGLVLASMTKDIAAQILAKALCFGGLGIVAYFLLLNGVTEQSTAPVDPLQHEATPFSSALTPPDAPASAPTSPGGATASSSSSPPSSSPNQAAKATTIPIVPAARRAMANLPYWRYLLMKVPLTLFSLIPSNMLSFFIKYNLALEDWSFFQNACFAVAIVGGVLAIPLAARLAKLLGKSRALGLLLGVEGVFMCVCFAIPTPVYRRSPHLTFLIMFFGGIGTSLPFTIPDALLADIIDYDELLSGGRNEGMYTVVETNLQQFVEIAGGVIPLMVLGIAGYEPLGGCSCGCGIKCAEPYLRWKCPARGSVGYSCTGQLGSPLLFAPEPELAPCAEQPNGGGASTFVIQLFMVGIPGFFALLGACACARLLITQEVHQQIRRSLDAAAAEQQQQQSAAATDGHGPLDPRPPPRLDPFTQRLVTPPPNTKVSLLREHFSAYQLRQAATRLGIAGYLGGRLCLWGGVTVLLVALMASSGAQNIVTGGCLVLTALWILIPWDGYRFYLLRAESELLEKVLTDEQMQMQADASTSSTSSTACVPLSPPVDVVQGLSIHESI